LGRLGAIITHRYVMGHNDTSTAIPCIISSVVFTVRPRLLLETELLLEEIRYTEIHTGNNASDYNLLHAVVDRTVIDVTTHTILIKCKYL